MKLCVLVFVLGTLLYGASSVTHSLKYFYTASSHVPNFPEFVAVGYVDDNQIVYYDSNIKKAVPKQDWMNAHTDAQYWETQSGNLLGEQQNFKGNIEIAKQRLNQTGGIHIVQYMYGCEWDDETNRVTGNRQFGYDGEDFISFDFETQTWIAPRHEAVITKNKLDKDEDMKAQSKHYYTQECPGWIKKYVAYGRATLMRTDLPKISLLQKTSSAPVTCHATGFYPDQAVLFWAKDGREVFEGVESWESLPNHDGTFQMSADLDMSSVKAEDWGKYSCVFQLSGVKEDIVTKLDKAVIRTNEKSNTATKDNVTAIIIITVVVVGLCVAVVLYKRRTAKRPPSHKRVRGGDMMF